MGSSAGPLLLVYRCSRSSSSRLVGCRSLHCAAAFVVGRSSQVEQQMHRPGILRQLSSSRKVALGAGILRSPGNCLSLRGTRQVSTPVDLNRLPNMWEKKRVRRKKVKMSRYEQKESDRGWHPELCVYETEYAKHEALYFYNLFAMPWEKGSWERFVDKLERKYFPDDLIDFEIEDDAKHHKKPSGRQAADAQQEPELQAAAAAEDAQPESKLQAAYDIQQVQAAATEPGEPEISFRPAEHVDETSKWTEEEAADDWQPITSAMQGGPESSQPQQVVTTVQAKPLLLKRNMDLPKTWDSSCGTVVLMDKPAGWTSFDVCNKLRRLLRVDKVGHAGTLDPFATGLLVVCVGKATKLADSYQAMTKVYSGTLRLGEATASYDCDTPVSEQLPWKHITDADVQRARDEFLGDIMQVPPLYSALKVEGERLYKKARRGEEFRVPPRMVSIYEFELERSSSSRQDFNFRVACSKGTYIRSLCFDLGRALNSCAYLTSLRREKIGHMSVQDAWPMAELTQRYTDEFMS